MVTLEISSASRNGCVRDHNEDMILVDNHFVRDDDYKTLLTLNHEDRFIVALADGMGGHNRGDVASSDTLHNLQYYYHDIPLGLNASDFNEAIVGWLDSINNFVVSKGRADEQFKGMGTTLVGLAYYAGDFYSLNCGDSRLYQFRDGELTQLTTDHSLNTVLGSEKHSSVITNCIGGGCTTSYIDIVRLTDDIRRDDIYLLCSDGLTDMVHESRISRMLSDGANANLLCEAAIEKGGLDNVSACVIMIK